MTYGSSSINVSPCLALCLCFPSGLFKKFVARSSLKKTWLILTHLQTDLAWLKSFTNKAKLGSTNLQNQAWMNLGMWTYVPSIMLQFAYRGCVADVIYVRCVDQRTNIWLGFSHLTPCFSSSLKIAYDMPNRHSMLSHTNFLTFWLMKNAKSLVSTICEVFPSH